MIDDASVGHRLTETVVEQFARPWDVFIEATP
jgi:hypothetical protein